MVKIYLKDKKEYFDIEYSSILKCFIMGWFSWTVIIGMAWIIIFFLVSIS